MYNLNRNSIIDVAIMHNGFKHLIWWLFSSFDSVFYSNNFFTLLYVFNVKIFTQWFYRLSNLLLFEWLFNRMSIKLDSIEFNNFIIILISAFMIHLKLVYEYDAWLYWSELKAV